MALQCLDIKQWSNYNHSVLPMPWSCNFDIDTVIITKIEVHEFEYSFFLVVSYRSVVNSQNEAGTIY